MTLAAMLPEPIAKQLPNRRGAAGEGDPGPETGLRENDSGLCASWRFLPASASLPPVSDPGPRIPDPCRSLEGSWRAR